MQASARMQRSNYDYYDRKSLRKLRKQRIKQELRDYKAQRGCCFCHDHRPDRLNLIYNDDAEKGEHDVNYYKNSGSRAKMYQEASKCSVVCFRCNQKLQQEVKDNQ